MGRPPLNETVLSGRYRLEAKLGSGGMAVVYLGEDDSGQRYAVKLALHVRSSDEASVKRFYREARSARRASAAAGSPLPP